MENPDPEIETRRAWMGLLARAPEGRVAALLGPQPAHAWLRAPETGTVMVRGRIGGTGGAFNLGEVTVTRCALRLENGPEGHATLQGRRKACAKAAALVDALMQTDAAPQIRKSVLDPLAQEDAARKAARAGKAAATKVDFFTLMRGED